MINAKENKDISLLPANWIISWSFSSSAIFLFRKQINGNSITYVAMVMTTLDLFLIY